MVPAIILHGGMNKEIGSNRDPIVLKGEDTHERVWSHAGYVRHVDFVAQNNIGKILLVSKFLLDSKGNKVKKDACVMDKITFAFDFF